MVEETGEPGKTTDLGWATATLPNANTRFDHGSQRWQAMAKTTVLAGVNKVNGVKPYHNLFLKEKVSGKWYRLNRKNTFSFYT